MTKPTNITASELNDFVEKNDFAVVDCWSPTCPPCLMLTPVIDELANKHAGKVAFAKISFANPANQRIAQRFGISGIPTILVFKNGEFVNKLVGYHSAEQLEAELGL